MGKKVFMYGAHEEGAMKANDPGSILATREGAICLASKDGAVWITHLREPKAGKFPYKLPAALVLGEEKLRAMGVEESAYDKFGSKGEQTYKQIWYEEHGEVGLLHFDFHNGAMSTSQCNLLLDAYKTAKQRPTKVLVLSGGKDFFSNGIHLNQIEANSNPVEESWNNIVAINAVVKEILFNTKQITVSAVEGNAGAGGVFLATAADQVVASESTVLNPHYKTMGLFGSELSTYTTPRRIGADRTKLIRHQCTPYSATAARKMRLIDHVIPRGTDFNGQVLERAQQLVVGYNSFLADKLSINARRKNKPAIMAAEAEELKKMYDNFQSDVYNTARKNFVYKVPVQETPMHLIKYSLNGANNGVKTRGNILNGNHYAKKIKSELKEEVRGFQEADPSFQPRLVIIQVGDRVDSNIYVNKKMKVAHEIGIKGTHLRLPEETTEEELLSTIDGLNENQQIHGIMLQLPLGGNAQEIDVSKALDLISPSKDVDCIGAFNRGNFIFRSIEMCKYISK